MDHYRQLDEEKMAPSPW